MLHTITFEVPERGISEASRALKALRTHEGDEGFKTLVKVGKGKYIPLFFLHGLPTRKVELRNGDHCISVGIHDFCEDLSHKVLAEGYNSCFIGSCYCGYWKPFVVNGVQFIPLAPVKTTVHMEVAKHSISVEWLSDESSEDIRRFYKRIGLNKAFKVR